MSANNASRLLEELDRQGIALEARGLQLRVRQCDALSPGLLERLRKHKAELLALLQAGDGGDDAPPAPWDQAVWHPPFWRCRCCGSRRRWRLAEGSEWVCERCHEPEPHYSIVWDGEEVRRG